MSRQQANNVELRQSNQTESTRWALNDHLFLTTPDIWRRFLWSLLRCLLQHSLEVMTNEVLHICAHHFPSTSQGRWYAPIPSTPPPSIHHHLSLHWWCETSSGGCNLNTCIWAPSQRRTFEKENNMKCCLFWGRMLHVCDVSYQQ